MEKNLRTIRVFMLNKRSSLSAWKPDMNYWILEPPSRRVGNTRMLWQRKWRESEKNITSKSILKIQISPTSSISAPLPLKKVLFWVCKNLAAGGEYWRQLKSLSQLKSISKKNLKNFYGPNLPKIMREAVPGVKNSTLIHHALLQLKEEYGENIESTTNTMPAMRS